MPKTPKTSQTKDAKTAAALIAEEKSRPIEDSDERMFVAALNAPMKAMSGYLDSPEHRDIALKIVAKAASILSTQDEIAHLFDIKTNAFKQRLLRDAELREAYDQGLASAKIALRRKQWRLADYNSGMAIFLGKNYLGQRDEKHLDVREKREVEHTVKADLGKLDTNDLKSLKGLISKMVPAEEEPIDITPETKQLDAKPN